MQLKKQPLLTAQQIRERVEALAETISADYAGRELTLITVLKGSMVFATDLMRHLRVPVTIDFVRARSYCQTESQGRCELLWLPQQPLADRHLLVIEDIIDTGITASAIMQYLQSQAPASVDLCSLLNKPDRRCTPVEARYTGFVIPDEFVVGYGMDYDERGRELPDIRVLTP